MKGKSVILSTVVLVVGMFVANVAHAGISPELSKVLIGTWSYTELGTGNAIRGSIRFDGLIAGVVFDNKYGKGTFTGKFISYYHFVGVLTFPSADKIHRTGKIYFNFYKNPRFPKGWTFKGGTEWKGANGMAISQGTRI